MITLTQLEYIVAIDEYRHFATAAEKCFVTQPTLSMQIKKLEDELGVIIFDRSRQPVVPTDLGAKLIEQARMTLSATQRIKEIIQEEKARKHKNKKADKRKVRTGGFVDEIDEEDVTGYSENKKKAAIQQTAQTAASEAHAELKKEIAAATSEEADMLSRLEMAERTVEENRKPHPAGKVEEVPEEEEEPVTIGNLAMPSYSAAQLASRVKKAGDAPDIVKDDITKVTLFDYSDIISGDVDDMEE